MDISFIILNYKSEKYLEKCISSIKNFISDVVYEIIVINNDEKRLDSCLTNDVRIINVFNNVGFSKACNMGAKIANGKVLFFLNPDTELLDEKIFSSLSLLDDSNIGIIAPTLITESGESQLWSGGKKLTPASVLFRNIFQKKIPSFSKKTPVTELDWVSGAALLIKKDLFETIKGFDENFFMYFEDVDLCLKVRNLKRKVLMLAESKVLHYGGGSANDTIAQKNMYYESQDYYFKKNFGKIQSQTISFFRRLSILIKKSYPHSKSLS